MATRKFRIEIVFLVSSRTSQKNDLQRLELFSLLLQKLRNWVDQQKSPPQATPVLHHESNNPGDCNCSACDFDKCTSAIQQGQLPTKNEAVHHFSSDRSNFRAVTLLIFITHNQRSLALIATPGIANGETIVTPPQNSTTPRNQQHWDSPLESKLVEQHEPHRHQTGHRVNTLDSRISSNWQKSSSGANSLPKWALTTDWRFANVWSCRPWWIRDSGKSWAERKALPW